MTDKDQGDEAPEDRAAVVARWNQLCRTVLPGMAATAGWPIRLDHCFMRVFLDAAVGDRWDTSVARPAVRHMPLSALRRAVALAEDVVVAPDRLPALNKASLEWRRASRDSAGRRGPPAT